MMPGSGMRSAASAAASDLSASVGYADRVGASDFLSQAELFLADAATQTLSAESQASL